MAISSHTHQRSLLPKIGWSITIILALYFVATRALHFFIVTPESYGPYFWPRAPWVAAHVAFGVLALLLGPFQFSSRIRSRHTRIHRAMGRIYLLCVLLGALAGLYLAATSKIGLTYTYGLYCLAMTWMITGSMAFLAIRKRNVEQHREWMLRSYVVTFAFVTNRIVVDVLEYLKIGEPKERLILMSWACWAVPLFFVEVLLQFRKIFRNG